MLPRSLVQQAFAELRPSGFSSLSGSGTLAELQDAQSFLLQSCRVSKQFCAALRPIAEKHLRTLQCSFLADSVQSSPA